MSDLASHLPALLMRARALLRLPGGPPGELAKAEVPKAAAAVLALHEGLVGGRALARAGTYDEAFHLGAYLLWWWPQTYEKTRAALSLSALPPLRSTARSGAGADELRARSVRPGPRILDLGAGPGPAAIAALDALGGEALAVDKSSAALAEARALGRVRTQELDLSREPAPPGFDLTLAANVLSELPAARRRALIEPLQGVVVLIEPALRETGRALLELRDGLLAGGAWKALAPCLTQRPCPALAAPKDWCTAEQRWSPPRHVVQLADATGLRADELLSFAPLVLARSAPVPQPGVFRVVGVPQPEKGKRRFFVCNDQGRLPLSRLDRQASPANEAFGLLERGDLVRLGALEQRGDGLRVGLETKVEKLR